MRFLLAALAWVTVALCQSNSTSNTSNFFTGTMTVAGDTPGGSQRIPKVSNRVVLLTMNELSYNTYFSLSMNYNISSFGDY